MKIKQEEVVLIRDRAIDIFRDLPTNLSWTNNRGEISENLRKSISYIEAINQVLQLKIDIEYYKEDGPTYVKV